MIEKLDHQPPYWVIKLIEAICPDHMLDEVEGDLFEYYATLSERKSKAFAKRKAIGFVLLSTPRLLFKRKYHFPDHIDMLKNYILIALRNIKRQLAYSMINIFGLAIGLACCILIGVYVINESSYDKFHSNADRIYRVNLTFKSSNRTKKTYMTPTALLPTLKDEFTEVKEGVRILHQGSFRPVVVINGNHKFQEKEFLYTDSTFFDIFSFDLINGNPKTCLRDPMSLVITKSTAEKYFGPDDALGKTLKVNDTDYNITGIVADVPHNSHIQFDFLASFTSKSASQQQIWGSANYATYVQLTDPVIAKVLENDINELVKKRLGDNLGDTQLLFDLMPITDIHLKSDVANEMQPQNDIKYIYIISVVGMLILLIACINYMNLATARSIDRAREVGMRKVLGALRKQVFIQFIGESAFITATAMVIAVILVSVSLPAFNQLTGKSLMVGHIVSLPVLVGLGATFFMATLLAGAYPAMSLSSFAPGKVLKGSFRRSKSGTWMRKALVVFQFSISIFLIIGMLVVNKQLNYMRNKKLGYNRENVLILPTDRSVVENLETIKNELEKRDGVTGVSSASESPTNIGGGYSITIPGEVEDAQNINALTVDRNFVKTMGMDIIKGRDFTETDQRLATVENNEERVQNFLINRELMDQLMLNDDEVIGKKAHINGREGEIIGVVENFHFTSLHSKINPLALFIEPWQFNMLFIRIKPKNLQKTLLAVEDTWSTILPDRPFVFQFMDDEYETLYRSEQRLGKVFTIFAVLAIVIACLGLLGLVAFAVQQRTKEIGVRKVLGASVSSLFFLISIDFSKLVFIAFFIAAPLGYWAMKEWLTDFEYQTSIGIWPIVIAVAGSLFIALLTVSFQSIKAAMMNPVDTLRSE